MVRFLEIFIGLVGIMGATLDILDLELDLSW